MRPAAFLGGWSALHEIGGTRMTGESKRVASLVASEQQNQTVTIKRPIPVHITYFTARIEDDGKLKLFNDVYGHEPKIMLGIEGKAHTIKREKEETGPIRAEAIGSLADTQREAKQDWRRRVFDNY